MKNVMNRLSHCIQYFLGRKQNHNIDNLKLDKIQVIDFISSNNEINSFADLGGIWGVNGGYTFYTMNKYKIKTAFLVDTNVTQEVLDKSKKYTGLTIINANFGDRNIAERIGKIDAILLFYVLLHQVKPDWDEILEM